MDSDNLAGQTETPESVSVSGATALPTVSEGRPAPAPTPTITSAPTLALIANLRDEEIDALEEVLVGVREAWQRGDQSAIFDALITQAAMMEALGVKLLRIAGTEKGLKAVQAYGNLALRAMEQARKTLATVAALRDKPRTTQTNVQVNLGGPQIEKLVNPHGQ